MLTFSMCQQIIPSLWCPQDIVPCLHERYSPLFKIFKMCWINITYYYHYYHCYYYYYCCFYCYCCIISKLLKTFIRLRHLSLVCCSTLVLFNRRTILMCPLNVRDLNFNLRCFLQKLFRIECRSMSEDFCWVFHTFFIPKWPLSWHIFRNRQLEGISVVAQQFHETLEPLNEWLTTIEKRLANCEPIGTQASKLEEQIAQHKVRYLSHISKIRFSISFEVLWPTFE